MLSVAESAELLEISGARVRALIADGALPATKVGRAWALREEDVMQRLASRPRGGRPKADVGSESGANDSAPGIDAARLRELQRLYRDCKEAFRFRPSAFEVASAESREEAAFYVAVADFFLKGRQAELVKAGAY